MTDLPPLPYDTWKTTKAHLHLILQVLGKVRMALHPKLNHWWHVPLYVSPHGFTTGPIPTEDRDLEMTLHVVDPRVALTCSTGATAEVPIEGGRSVADFYRDLTARLADMGYHPKLRPTPYDPALVGSDIPFPDDVAPRPWDGPSVRAFWQINRWATRVLTEFRGRYLGKSSPVHLFWHSLDLAYTRFSGRARPRESGSNVEREAYSHEVTSVGFWAGDANVPEPSFYAYAYPEPAGLADEPLRPGRARWNDLGGSHMALLTYEDLRGTDEPRESLLDFCESTFQAAARRAEWDVPSLTAPWA